MYVEDEDSHSDMLGIYYASVAFNHYDDVPPCTQSSVLVSASDVLRKKEASIAAG